MIITEKDWAWHEIKAVGASWRDVVKAFTPDGGFGPGFSNISEDWRLRVFKVMESEGGWHPEDADPELYPHAADDVVLMARDPAFGAIREFDATKVPPLLPDDLGGWYVLEEDTATYLHAESGSSGSSITAERQPDGTWTLTGQFPVKDGELYRGVYYYAFASAVELDTPLAARA